MAAIGLPRQGDATLRLERVMEHVRLENAHDLERVMATFGDDGFYDDAPWGEHHAGLGAVRFTFDAQHRLAGERIYYDRATVLRQLGVFFEPDSLRAKMLTPLTHPVTMLQAMWWAVRGRRAPQS